MHCVNNICVRLWVYNIDLVLKIKWHDTLWETNSLLNVRPVNHLAPLYEYRRRQRVNYVCVHPSACSAEKFCSASCVCLGTARYYILGTVYGTGSVDVLV